ncbi:MAG: glutaredoxin family protein [Rubrivivax sp.]
MSLCRPIATALTLALLSLAGQASAQGVYRIVGPDGRVSFSDQPPSAQAPAAPAAGSSRGAAAGAALPYELRQTSNRYPVTFYSATDCAPCNAGRNLLNSRGIPYTEKTVSSQDDAEALKRLAGEAALPLLTIGSQRLKGFSEPEWTQYLDAAGYPKQSMLPSGYRRPAPSPLVTVQVPAAKAPADSATPAPRAPAEVPVAPPATNPAGIRF